MKKFKMELTGSQKVTVDDKGRVPLPSKLLAALKERGAIEKNEDLEVVITVGETGNLSIYLGDEFQAMMGRLREKAKSSLGMAKLYRSFVINQDSQGLDKANRVKLPALLQEKFQLHGEVVASGVVDHIEIVPKDVWFEELDRVISGRTMISEEEALFLMSDKLKNDEDAD